MKCDSVTIFFMVAGSRTKTDDEDMMKEQSEVQHVVIDADFQEGSS